MARLEARLAAAPALAPGAAAARPALYRPSAARTTLSDEISSTLATRDSAAFVAEASSVVQAVVDMVYARLGADPSAIGALQPLAQRPELTWLLLHTPFHRETYVQAAAAAAASITAPAAPSVLWIAELWAFVPIVAAVGQQTFDAIARIAPQSYVKLARDMRARMTLALKDPLHQPSLADLLIGPTSHRDAWVMGARLLGMQDYAPDRLTKLWKQPLPRDANVAREAVLQHFNAAAAHGQALRAVNATVAADRDADARQRRSQQQQRPQQQQQQQQRGQGAPRRAASQPRGGRVSPAPSGASRRSRGAGGSSGGGSNRGSQRGGGSQQGRGGGSGGGRGSAGRHAGQRASTPARAASRSRSRSGSGF